MRRYSKEIKSIKRKFDNQLKELYKTDKEIVLSYIWYKRIHKTNISKERKLQIIEEAKSDLNKQGLTNDEFISFLIKKQVQVKDIVQNFKTAVVNELSKNEVRLNHISLKSPDELGYILKPHLAETIYNETIGNYVFATLEEKSKLAYAVRSSTGGMFKISENMILYPTNNNLEIKNGKVSLIKPVYVYSLQVDSFEPVVTVRIDSVNSTKTPTIVFDDEWVSPETIHITDKICLKLYDVTELMEYQKVFMFNNKDLDKNVNTALNFVSKNKRDLKKLLQKHMLDNKITFVNSLIKEQMINAGIKK